jgi:hypothetical protein
LVYFGGPWNGKDWYILWPFGIFYGHEEFFITILYICAQLVYFFPVLVCCNKKNLATLLYRLVGAETEGNDKKNKNGHLFKTLDEDLESGEVWPEVFKVLAVTQQNVLWRQSL